MSFDARASESSRQTRRAALLWTAIVGLLTTLVAVFSIQGRALVTTTRPDSAPSSPEALPQGPIYSLVLPHDPPELPPGPHREQVVLACTICHSARLLMNQPPFPREKWTEVVHKMAVAYGASISPNEEPELVDYLVTVRGR